MTCSSKILDELSVQAKQSDRLRCNYDLRNSPQDQSQRMLNALEPGTIVPIHQHDASSETVALLRGKVRVQIYTDNNLLIEQYEVSSKSECPFYVIPKGTRHSIECLESGTIIFECKDGPYMA